MKNSTFFLLCFALCSGCNSQGPVTEVSTTASETSPTESPQQLAELNEDTKQAVPETTLIDRDNLLTPQEIASVVGYEDIVRREISPETAELALPTSRLFIANPKSKRFQNYLHMHVHFGFPEIVDMNRGRYAAKEGFQELENIGEKGFASQTENATKYKTSSEFNVMFAKNGHGVTLYFSKEEGYEGKQTVENLQQLIDIAKIVSNNLDKHK